MLHSDRKQGFSADWRANRDPEAYMISLQSFLRKGVSLGYVERIKSKGPKGLFCGSSLLQGEVLAYGGLFQTPKGLQESDVESRE